MVACPRLVMVRLANPSFQVSGTAWSLQLTIIIDVVKTATSVDNDIRWQQCNLPGWPGVIMYYGANI